jgi:hypothetical protein
VRSADYRREAWENLDSPDLGSNQFILFIFYLYFLLCFSPSHYITTKCVPLISSACPFSFTLAPTMLGPALSPLAIVDPHIMLAGCSHGSNDAKPPPLFFQHSLQIIQLVEGQPPPPRRITTIIGSSTSGSPSYSSSTPYSDSESDDGDTESICSSYCSSSVPPDRLELPLEHDPHHDAPPDESYSARMKRIFAWRNHFSTGLGSSSGISPSSSPKPFSAYAFSQRYPTLTHLEAEACE